MSSIFGWMGFIALLLGNVNTALVFWVLWWLTSSKKK